MYGMSVSGPIVWLGTRLFLVTNIARGSMGDSLYQAFRLLATHEMGGVGRLAVVFNVCTLLAFFTHFEPSDFKKALPWTEQ